MSRLGTELEYLSLLNSKNWSLKTLVDYIAVYEDLEHRVFWSSCENDGMARIAGPFLTYDLAIEKANQMLSYIF